MGMKVVGGLTFIGCKIRVKTLQTTEPKDLKSQLSWFLKCVLKLRGSKIQYNSARILRNLTILMVSEIGEIQEYLRESI